ncbi:MAG: type II toxin-antitoxin system RelE/ParE family toxin [Sphingobacteriales bacterium]|nr:type II toxin-antitoxin system RelE/ParE family toxin [Sphingobacteriales bacterium]
MNYEVKTIQTFEKGLKRLSRKYPSLKSEYFELVQQLKVNPEQGTPIGHHCFKIRLAIASKGAGKSGGARLITCVKVVETTVYLLTIFDKAEKENIPDKELKQLLKLLP